MDPRHDESAPDHDPFLLPFPHVKRESTFYPTHILGKLTGVRPVGLCNLAQLTTTTRCVAAAVQALAWVLDHLITLRIFLRQAAFESVDRDGSGVIEGGELKYIRESPHMAMPQIPSPDNFGMTKHHFIQK
jgi:hypothetical protein